MTTTITERPSIFGLTAAERRAAYDEASERAMEAARAAALAYKSKHAPDPLAQQYRLWNTMGMVCVLVVKHRDKPASIEISRDGSYYPHTYLPTSKMIVQPESVDQFVLAVVPKWLAQRAELMGITLPLSPARPWTDEQRAAWERLGRLRSSINTRIYSARKRIASNFTRNQVA